MTDIEQATVKKVHFSDRKIAESFTFGVLEIFYFQST